MAADLAGRRSRAFWIAVVLAVGVSLILVPLRAAPATAGSGGWELGWKAEAQPFRLTFLRHGRPLVGQAAGRMAYDLADGGSHTLTDVLGQRAIAGGRQYTVATDEPGRTAEVSVRRTPRGLRVGWALRPATGVVRVYETLTGSDAEHFLGGGANATFVDLRHRIVLNKVLFAGAGSFDRCTRTSAPSPFFLSSHGYAVFPDTTAVGRLAFPNAVDTPPDCAPADPPPCPVATGVPDRTQLCFKTDHLEYEVYAGSPAEVVRAYSAVAGRPLLPPPAQFGVMKWRDTVHGTAEVKEDVDQFQRLGIPLTTVWIDNPWEIENVPPDQVSASTSCMGTLTFDPQMFPDPREMIDYVHARGVRLGLWISPYVQSEAAGKPCPPNDFRPQELIPAPPETTRKLVDFTHPGARARWQEKLRKVLAMGIDMVKGDRGDGERDLESIAFHRGPGTLFTNTYPVLYEQATRQVLRELYGNDYMDLFRGGYTGAPATLHGFWQGDQRMTFEALRSTVRRGQSSWLTGHPVWGSDTGGYSAQGDPTRPSPPLLVRWAQLSAVSPIFEIGGGGRNATPWVYDTATIDRIRDNAVLHHELFPYLYSLAKESARTGVPITRPLAFEYPHDEEAWKADQQFLIGRDLLAAMVTADSAEQDGQAGRPTPVDVYLPAGQWIDLHTGEVLAGGRHITRNSTLDDFPLFARAGSAIGFNLRDPNGLPWQVNDLDRKGLGGWLYAPVEGTTRQNGLTAVRHGDRLTLRLNGAPAQAQVFIPTPATPSGVRIDGRATDRGKGWTTTAGRFPGVLLKLRTHHGQATVTLTLP